MVKRAQFASHSASHITHFQGCKPTVGNPLTIVESVRPDQCDPLRHQMTLFCDQSCSVVVVFANLRLHVHVDPLIRYLIPQKQLWTFQLSW